MLSDVCWHSASLVLGMVQVHWNQNLHGARVPSLGHEFAPNKGYTNSFFFIFTVLTIYEGMRCENSKAIDL